MHNNDNEERTNEKRSSNFVAKLYIGKIELERAQAIIIRSSM